MSAIAPVIDAVHVILRRLGDLPEGPEVAELRDRALACIEEVVAWNTAQVSSARRNATMVRVLALHVATNKLASSLLESRPARPSPSSPPNAAQDEAQRAARLPSFVEDA